MARKRIADKEPTISNDGTAAAPAKTPTTNMAPSEPVRAPRSSANSVNHRHKKEANSWEAVPAVEVPTPSTPGLASLAASVTEPVASSTTTALQITREQIAIRAYLLAEARGFQGGSMEDDWFTAEHQLQAELG